jgi:hypothetical protein
MEGLALVVGAPLVGLVVAIMVFLRGALGFLQHFLPTAGRRHDSASSPLTPRSAGAPHSAPFEPGKGGPVPNARGLAHDG